MELHECECASKIVANTHFEWILPNDKFECTYVPYLNSWKGRYKIPHPTGMYVFLPRAPKAQGEEILVHSHRVRCFIPPRLTVEVRHSWPVHPTANIFPNNFESFWVNFCKFSNSFQLNTLILRKNIEQYWFFVKSLQIDEIFTYR